MIISGRCFTSWVLIWLTFKIEYGYDAHGDLYLADEISPDSMRLWKIGSDERFDKDLFRKDEGDIVPAYREILDRLQPLAIQ